VFGSDFSNLTVGIYSAAAITLPNGVYTGSVTVQPSGGGAPTIISVTLTVTGKFILSPASITATTNRSVQQTLSVKGAADPMGFTAKPVIITGTGSSGRWLDVVQVGTQFTPIDLTVTINSGGLSPGTYQGAIDLLPSRVGAAEVVTDAQRVAVTLNVQSTGDISVSTNPGTPVTSLSFAAQVGGQAPGVQSFRVSSAAGAAGIPFTYSSGAPWLLLNNAPSGQALTQATLAASVNPANLAAGSYNANITLVPTGGQTVTIPVALSVTPSSFVSASPASFTANYAAGGPAPAPQTIQVSGNGGALPFTAAATSAGNWLAVSPSTGSTSAGGTTPLTVSFVNLAALSPNQTYTGTVVVSGASGSTGSTTINVSLTVTAALPTINGLTNAASFTSGGLSAGEIITIFGTALGPQTGVAVTPDLLTDSRLPTTLGGTQVLVSGIPAPLLYASATQISAIVPYEVSSPIFLQNLNVQVRYQGQTSNGVSRSQLAAAPGLFTADASGGGQGAILNSDLSPNSAANPAKKGDIVVLYLTGDGQTIPGSVSGKLTPTSPPFPQPILPPSVTIGGLSAPVVFYAEAPGLVAGVLQINVQVPNGAGSGDLPVVVAFGDARSQLTAAGTGAVTLTVR
jgi:uncharacterized protein (TIGR03437 family)